jgi:predicted nucleic acid-binding protein
LTKYLLDSFAWIEYFEGSNQGAEVEKIISDPHSKVLMCAVMVAEVVSKAKRSEKDEDTAYMAMETLSRVLEIDAELAKLAGSIHAQMKKKFKDFGMMDAFLLAAAQQTSATIVTGDPRFKTMDNVEFLG